MAGFLKKIWKPRIVEHPGRRRLNDTSQPEVYDVSRAEGNIVQEGDGFTADNMNGLEERIERAFEETDSVFSDAFSEEKSYDAGSYVIYENELYRFGSSKSAGEWDPSKVFSTTVAEEFLRIENESKSKLPTSTVRLYVSPSGSDETGDGTQAHPWRQIKYAIKAQPIQNHVLCEIHAAGGTYDGFSISDRRVTLYIEGHVTIVAASENNTCIGVTLYGFLSISTPSSETRYNLSLSGGKNGIELSHFSYCSITSYIQEIIFNNLNYSCIYSSYNSVTNCTAPYRVNSTCTCPNIFVASIRGYINMRYSTLGGSINSKPSAAFSALQGGTIYTRYANISSNCTNGLQALEGGQIYYSSTTNNAQTKFYTNTGGRIYASTQTNPPSY